ncbi:MAG TPA: CHAP domain-containing protein [Solirubrobacterales bacterium]|nr:CHAP domain-containing protein [Solirubrobacterales bacterium]
MPEESAVHRGLILATPIETGPDVRELQEWIKRRGEHFRFDFEIAIDGEFGDQTFRLAKAVAISMGAGRNGLKALRKGRVSESVQRLIRGVREKTRWERVLTAKRRRYRGKLRRRYDRSGGEKALAEARRQVGVTENPPGSNWGGMVERFIRFCGYGFPVYWCGCFACWCVIKGGGAKIPTPIRLGYDGYIVADAKAGANGLTAVSFDRARAGDIVVYGFNHIGVVERVSGDTLYAIEGNTSSGSSGSQSNGGGVFARTRSRADVICVARPDYG